jgi:PKD repeat protein
MKKNVASFLIISLVLLLTGCYKDPSASFTMSASSIEVDQSITFTNTSLDMDRCEWIFGDGEQSTETNPTHTYTDPGTYQVTLRVFSKKDMKADFTSDVVNVIQPTYLIIHVYDLENSDPLDSTTVTLYNSENDFFYDTNNIGEAITNSSGMVSFKNVPTGKIYISAVRMEYELSGYIYFYSNWFTNLDGNTYNTDVSANKINELDIYVRLGYVPSGRIVAYNAAQVK